MVTKTTTKQCASAVSAQRERYPVMQALIEVSAIYLNE